MKSLLLLILLCTSAVAGPSSLIGYNGTTAQSPIKQGTTQILFIPKSFTGTIGNTGSFSLPSVLVINARQSGDTLSDLSYTVASGTLSILEVR